MLAAARRSTYVRSTAPRTRRSATTCSTPALTRRATCRYKLAAGTSDSLALSCEVVSARSPKNACTIRSRTGCKSRSAEPTMVEPYLRYLKSDNIINLDIDNIQVDGPCARGRRERSLVDDDVGT